MLYQALLHSHPNFQRYTSAGTYVSTRGYMFGTSFSLSLQFLAKAAIASASVNLVVRT